MNRNAYIDITKIEPQSKHPKILEAFDSLKETESLLLHSDHDPKSLYQL
jgi:regulator of cell morphogenesis and NO signaling